MKNTDFFSTIKKKCSIYQISHSEIEELKTTVILVDNNHLSSLDMEFFIITTSEGEIINVMKNTSKNDSHLHSLIKKIAKYSPMKNGQYMLFSFAENTIVSYKKHLVFFIVLKNKSSKSKVVKLFLQFMSICFYNFIGEKSDIILKNSQSLKDYIFAENFQVKIFEQYFAYPSFIKFENIIKNVFSSALNMEHDKTSLKTKLREVYIIDDMSNSILFRLSSMIPVRKKVLKFEQNEELWNELLYQCQEVKSINSGDPFNTPVFTIGNANNAFIDKIIGISNTIEISSSFPKYYFIVKHISVNHGYYSIQVYTTLRSSRNHKHYHEFYTKSSSQSQGLITSNFIQNKHYLQFEKFFIEYFSCFNSFTSKYHYNVSHLYYFDQDILYMIDHLLNSKVSFSDLLNNISQCLHDHFMNQSGERASHTNFESCLQYDKYIFQEIFRDREYFEMSNSIKDVDGRKISHINHIDIDNTLSIYDFTMPIDRRKSTNTRNIASLEQYYMSAPLQSDKSKLKLIRSIQEKLIRFDDNGNSFIKTIKHKRYSFNPYNNNILFQKKENKILYEYFNHTHIIEERVIAHQDSHDPIPLNYIPKTDDEY